MTPDIPQTRPADVREEIARTFADIVLEGGAISPRSMADRILAGRLGSYLTELEDDLAEARSAGAAALTSQRYWSGEASRAADLVASLTAETTALREHIAAVMEEQEELRARFDRLLIAFHDTTRRHVGVTPDSGAEFYDPRLADEAEARRPHHGAEQERAERPEVKLAAAEARASKMAAALREAETFLMIVPPGRASDTPEALRTLDVVRAALALLTQQDRADAVA